jgi:hypothetical protein
LCGSAQLRHAEHGGGRHRERGTQKPSCNNSDGNEHVTTPGARMPRWSASGVEVHCGTHFGIIQLGLLLSGQPPRDQIHPSLVPCIVDQGNGKRIPFRSRGVPPANILMHANFESRSNSRPQHSSATRTLLHTVPTRKRTTRLDESSIDSPTVNTIFYLLSLSLYLGSPFYSARIIMEFRV